MCCKVFIFLVIANSLICVIAQNNPTTLLKTSNSSSATSITTSDLIQSIVEGISLPLLSIIITYSRILSFPKRPLPLASNNDSIKYKIKLFKVFNFKVSQKKKEGLIYILIIELAANQIKYI